MNSHMISCESTLILNGVADKVIEGKFVCHSLHKYCFSLNPIYFTYISSFFLQKFPLWANACLNSIWKTKLWLKQYNGKLKTASSFSAVALQLECVLYSPDPKDESTLCLTAWVPSWSLRGGRKAGTHATSPLGIGWCPLTDWGCKDVFTFVYCVRLRVLH